MRTAASPGLAGKPGHTDSVWVRICVSANPVEFLSASPALTTAYAAASEIDSILKAVRSDVTDVFGKISC